MVLLLPAFLLSWSLNSFTNCAYECTKGNARFLITMGEWKPREVCVLAIVKGTHSCPPSPKHLRLDTPGNLPLRPSFLHMTLTLAAAFGYIFLVKGPVCTQKKRIAYFLFLLSIFFWLCVCFLSQWRTLEETYLSYTGSERDTDGRCL